MHRIVRIVIGFTCWVAVGLWTGRLATRERPVPALDPVAAPSQGRSTASLLLGHFLDKRAELIVVFAEPVLLEVGDAVLISSERAGQIEALLDEKERVVPALFAGRTRAALVRISESARRGLRSDATARVVQVPQAFPWVVQTLLPRENIIRIAEVWNDTMLAHREEIFTLVTPLLRDLILDIERHIEAELRPFLARHRPEVAILVKGFEDSAGGARFTRLFVEEIWPIAQEKLRPIIDKASQELWDALPLWGLTWRLAYQTLPLTDNDHLTKAWSRFLETEALPMFQSHSEELFQATREVLREALGKESVSGYLRDAFAGVLSNPQFHILSQTFVREVFLDSRIFHDLLQRRLQSPEAQRALEAASVHMEPMIRKMGDILLGDREQGITREFARVLRSQILLKDLHRIEITPGTPAAPPLPPGAKIEASVELEFGK